jgi:hypothetical protein
MSELSDAGTPFFGPLLEKVTCPHCWHRFAAADTLWISEHPDLLGDRFLGPYVPQRFLPNRFTPQEKRSIIVACRLRVWLAPIVISKFRGGLSICGLCSCRFLGPQPQGNPISSQAWPGGYEPSSPKNSP